MSDVSFHLCCLCCYFLYCWCCCIKVCFYSLTYRALFGNLLWCCQKFLYWKENSINNTSNKQRKCKIIWFNPPYNKSIVTNVTKIFLKLLDKHFLKNIKLHKIFNRNSVKLRYSCTENNISQTISNHNKNTLQPIKNQELPCNCRQKENCPMQDKYRMKNILWKCIASTPTKPQRVYVGISEDEWKK